MKSKDLIEEIEGHDTCALVHYSRPIVEITRSKKGSFLIADGKVTYDATSEKLHLTSCGMKEWAMNFRLKDPMASESDFLETIEVRTSHLIPEQKEEYKKREIEYAKKKFAKVDMRKGLEIHINDKKTYMMSFEAAELITKLDPEGNLPVIIDGYPASFVESLPIYYDGYCSYITNGKYIVGGYPEISSKDVIKSGDKESWIDYFAETNIIREFDKVLEYFDLSEMDEELREKTIVDMKKYFDEMLPIYEKYFFKDIKKWKDEGREMMVIDFFGGPMIVPVPLGDCPDCGNFIEEKCTLGKEEEKKCKNIKNGFMHFVPKEKKEKKD